MTYRPTLEEAAAALKAAAETARAMARAAEEAAAWSADAATEAVGEAAEAARKEAWAWDRIADACLSAIEAECDRAEGTI